MTENQLVVGIYALTGGCCRNLEIAVFVDVVLKTAPPNVHFRRKMLITVVVAIQFRTTLFLLTDVNVDVARPANRKEAQVAFVVFHRQVKLKRIILVIGDGIGSDGDF